MSNEGGVSGTFTDRLVLCPQVAALEQVHVVVMGSYCNAASIWRADYWNVFTSKVTHISIVACDTAFD